MDDQSSCCRGVDALGQFVHHYFNRFDEKDDFTLRNTAEYLAFQAIAAQLDRVLIEPFEPNYKELIMEAKARLADGYEEPAPGVVYE